MKVIAEHFYNEYDIENLRNISDPNNGFDYMYKLITQFVTATFNTPDGNSILILSLSEKLVLKKFDPIARKHATYTETKKNLGRNEVKERKG
jgi:hypothetical protein